MYLPSDDTFFISEIIESFRGQSALEIGIGSGYLTKILCNNYKFVVGIDIDYDAVEYAKNFTSDYRNKLLICCDLNLLPINYNFDMILSNPPYLPNDYEDKKFDNEKITDRTIYGGQSGIEFTLKILQLFSTHMNKEGRIILIKSSLSKSKIMDKYLSTNSLKKRTIAEKKFFFETLKVLEITRN